MGPIPIPLRIPTVDFPKERLKPGTAYWKLMRDEVRMALEEYGCFEAVYNGVPVELHNAVFNSVEELFDLPMKTKIKNTSDKPYFGFNGKTPLLPLMESLGIDDAPVLEKTQSFTNLMWPNGNSEFCKTVHAFTERVAELEELVKRMVFESFGVEKYYDSFTGSNYLLRVMKYDGTNGYKLGAIPHTDKSILTIVHQNQVNGLEVQTRGGEWISVTPSRSSFIVLIGDAFMAWSNGRLHNPLHRVIMNGKDTRFSIALFSFSKGMIQTPDELVDEEHPLLFKPFDNFGFLRFYSTEEGQKAESTIKAYCGL
ncbi:hypothetical protein NE237_014879 [Protea cynaroides]|uniref:Fe2OG dioxygenase domain-containing protein n=1 Tax=Protea cynaroides TaxID=273540 RepID=A0A9Q0KCT1_9MAGN|nr:hypothetical protein NE237_014879 [Protea cynaroides]